jgi:hypothetical protein
VGAQVMGYLSIVAGDWVGGSSQSASFSELVRERSARHRYLPNGASRTAGWVDGQELSLDRRGCMVDLINWSSPELPRSRLTSAP